MRALIPLPIISWILFMATSWAKPIPPELLNGDGFKKYSDLVLSNDFVDSKHGTPYNSYRRRHPNPLVLPYFPPLHLTPSKLLPRTTISAASYPIPSTALALNLNTLTVIPGNSIPFLLSAASKNIYQRGRQYGTESIVPASPTILAVNLRGFTLHLEGLMTYHQALQVIQSITAYMQQVGYGTVTFDVVNTENGESHPIGRGLISM